MNQSLKVRPSTSAPEWLKMYSPQGFTGPQSHCSMQAPAEKRRRRLLFSGLYFSNSCPEPVLTNRTVFQNVRK
jgi:hypothetical protein|eukprot:COSAG06_NODE_1259_length_10075_cov_50.687049_5_plen_73_part_00